jgi:uncharacterized protein YdhG (YjbR/CyaY superfamily)
MTEKKRAGKKSSGLSADEKAAMRDRMRELKAEAEKANDESAVLAKIAEMPESDRKIAERIHAIIRKNAPELSPKLWYGMQAYAKDGNVVCFFQNSQKIKARYSTLGFNDRANLDDGNLWPTSFAVKKLTAAEEAMISTLVKKAVSG